MAGQNLGGKIGQAIGGDSAAGRDIGRFIGQGGIFGYAACRIHFLSGGGCSKPPTSANITMYNNIFSSAVFSAMTTCKGQGVSREYQSINCDTPAGFEQNLGCTSCTSAVSDILKARQDLEKQAHEVNPNYVEQTPNAEVVKLLAPGEFCATSCKSCAFYDISQNDVVNTSITCVSSTNFVAKVRNNISVATTQMAKTATDVTGDLAGILSGESDCIVSNISNRINQRVSDDDIVNLASKAVNYQQINVTGRSVYMKRLKQAVSFEDVFTFVEQSNFFTAIYSQEETRAGQQAVVSNQNFNEILDDLSDSVKTGVSLVNSEFGQLLIGLVVAGAGVLIVGAILLTSNPELRHALFGG